MNSAANYFELFQLAPEFELDQKLLGERFRSIQAEVHPDKHAAGSDQEQRLAMQYSTYANDAYQCLKSPLRRAAYLLEMVGEGRDFDNYTLSDGAFLMQQMELREALADTSDSDAVEALTEQVEARLKEEEAKFVSTYLQQEYPAARDSVSRMHFMHKMISEAELRIEELDD